MTSPVSEAERWSIRRARNRDVPSLCALVNSAYRGEPSKQGWTTEADLLAGQRTDAEDLHRLIENPDCVFLLLIRNKELLGCVCVKKKPDRAYIGMLTIRPEQQARGWGKKLLAQAERWAQEEWKFQTLELSVIRQRKELIAWYKRRGWHPTGKREPFPYGDERFGIPKVDDLEFVMMEKSI